MKITRQQVISNLSLSAAAAFGVQLINLFILPLFIDGIGEELYSLWVLSGVVIGYFQLMDAGFGAGLQRYLAAAHAKRDEDDGREADVTFSTGLVLLFAVGAIVALAMTLGRYTIVDFFEVSPENRDTGAGLLLVGGLFAMAIWPCRAVDLALKAVMRVKEVNLIALVGRLVETGALLAMVYFRWDLLVMKGACSVIMLLFFVPRYRLLRRALPELSFSPRRFRFAKVRQMSRFSLGMMYGAVMTILATQLSPLIVGKMVSLAAIAVYSVCAAPSLAISRILRSVVGDVLFPAAVNLHAESEQDRLKNLTHQGILYRGMATMPLVACAVVFMPYFLRLWMGDDYVQYAVWAQLCVLTHVFLPFGIASNIAKATTQLRLVNGWFTIRIALVVCLSVALTSWLGVGGPIVSTLLGHVFLGDVWLYVVLCRRLEMSPLPAIWGQLQLLASATCCAGAAYALAAYAPPDSWLLLFAEAGVLFAATCAVLYALHLPSQGKADIRMAIMALRGR